MATTLYLIRHGETEGSGIKRYKGSLDVPLSEEGISRMEKTAGLLRSLMGSVALGAVYSSALKRAFRSAEIIAGPNGLTPLVVHELRERGFGAWEGMSFDEIRLKYPAEFDSWAKDPLRFSPVGGESTLEVRERVIPAINKILNLHKGETLAVVAHGGVNRVILCGFMGVPLENIFRIEQDYGAVNIVEFYEGYPVVKGINLRP